MAVSSDKSKKDKKASPPAKTLEARENQLIALSVDEAERRIRNGTVSAQVLTHYLRLGTTKAQLEKQKLEQENKLLMAKTEALESAKKMEELYAEALSAMTAYRGDSPNEGEELDA
jgi:hypothetical protein